jgi:hypothetical protein
MMRLEVDSTDAGIRRCRLEDEHSRVDIAYACVVMVVLMLMMQLKDDLGETSCSI